MWSISSERGTSTQTASNGEYQRPAETVQDEFLVAGIVLSSMSTLFRVVHPLRVIQCENKSRSYPVGCSGETTSWARRNETSTPSAVSSGGARAWLEDESGCVATVGGS
jgi:hypothetical protein